MISLDTYYYDKIYVAHIYWQLFSLCRAIAALDPLLPSDEAGNIHQRFGPFGHDSSIT